MFTTVAKNFAKFLAAYFCLLVAFALSFCVLFPNYQSFNVMVPAAVVKTLVMMAGEIEYENFIYENGDALFDFTGHLMILIFTVLVSIILMNLLVGLAVSDIQVNKVKNKGWGLLTKYLFYPSFYLFLYFYFAGPSKVSWTG